MLVVLYKVRQHRLGDRSSPAFGEWGAQAGAAGKRRSLVLSLRSTPLDSLSVPGYTPVGGESST